MMNGPARSTFAVMAGGRIRKALIGAENAFAPLLLMLITLILAFTIVARLFVQHAGRILTHRQILREVWGPNAEEETNYLRVYVTGLRKKIEENPQMPELIVTEPGVGYRLRVLPA